MEKTIGKEDAGLFQVKQVYYKQLAAGSTPTVRTVFGEVGGNYGTITLLVREINREHLKAQTIIGGLSETVQNAILAQIAGLLEPREAAIRSMYASEQQMLEEAIEQLRVVESDNERLVAKLARSQSDHAAKERDLSVRLSATGDTVALLQRRCADLESDKEKFIRETERANSEASVANADHARAEDRINSLERQLAEKDAALAGLSQKLTEAEIRASTAASNLAELDRSRLEIARLTTKLDDARESLAATTEKLYQKSVELVAAGAKRPKIGQNATKKGKGNGQRLDTEPARVGS